MNIEDIFGAMRPMPPFKPEMRAANRKEIKRQTRRVMVPQPISTTGFWKDLHWANEEHFRKGAIELCPYGKVGDYAYMREPLECGIYDEAFYKDDDSLAVNAIALHLLSGKPIPWRWKRDTLSGMFMPKEAARFIYRYTDIRVERVQDISEEDVVKEGVSPHTLARGVIAESPPDPRWAFIELWNRINASRGYGWDVNPWVWVLSYEPVEVGHEG